MLLWIVDKTKKEKFMPRFQISRFSFFLYGILFFFCFAELLAQELERKTLQSKFEQIEKDERLEPSLKTLLQETYKKIFEQIDQTEILLIKSGDWENLLNTLPQNIENTKKEIATFSESTPAETVLESNFVEFESQLTQAEFLCTEAHKKIYQHRGQSRRQDRRSAEIPELLVSLKRKLDDVKKQKELVPSSEESPFVVEANRFLLLATQKQIEAEIESTEREQKYYEANKEWRSLQEELLQLRRGKTEKEWIALYSKIEGWLQKEITEFENEKNIETDIKNRLQVFYTQILQQINSARAISLQSIGFKKQILDTPEQLQKIREELKSPLPLPKLDLLENTPIAQIEVRISEADVALSVLKKEAEKLQEEQKRRASRITEILKLSEDAKQNIEKIDQQLSAPTLEEPEKIQKVRQMYGIAQRIALKSEQSGYKEELTSYEIREELLLALQNKAGREVSFAEKRLELLKTFLDERKNLSIDQFSLTPEKIQEQIKQIESKKELDEKLKLEIIDSYQKTLQILKEIDNKNAEITKFDQQRLEAPALLEKMRAEKPLTFTRPEIPAEMLVPQVEQLFNSTKNELSESRNRLSEIDGEEKRRADRRLNIPKEILEAKQALEEVNKQLVKSSDPLRSFDLNSAQKIYLLARKKWLETLILATEKEVLNYNARMELLPLRREQAAKRVAYLERMVKAYEEVVNNKREEEVKKGIEEAKATLRTMANAHPIVRAVAEENQELANQRKVLPLKQMSHELNLLQKEYEDFNSNATWVRNKIATAGLTETLGYLLRTEKEKFLDLRALKRNNLLRENEVTFIQITLLELQKKRSDLYPDIETKTNELLMQLEASISSEQKEAIALALDGLLKTKAENLDSLLKDYKGYQTLLIDFDVKQKDFIRKATEYANFIDEHILWVRSSSPVKYSDFKEFFSALHWLFDEKEWSQIGRNLSQDIRSSRIFYTFFFLLMISFFFLRQKLLGQLEILGNRAGLLTGSAIASLNITFQAFLLTALTALIFPSLIYFIAWRFSLFPDECELGKAIGEGLKSLAWSYFFFELIRIFCYPKGLGESHFRWNSKGLRFIRAELFWFTGLTLPAFFLISLMEWQNNDIYRQSFGRFIFIFNTLLLSFFFQRLFRPSSVLMEDLLRKHKEKAIFRFRYFWYSGLICFPLGLAGIAFIGYYYTSLQLTQRCYSTIFLLLGILAVYATIIRWFSLARLQLVMKQIQVKKDAQNSASASTSGSGSTSQITSGILVSAKGATNEAVFASLPQLDLSSINAQTQQLAKTFLYVLLFLGLWFIWRDVFPALGILKSVPLSYGINADGEKIVYLSLADLALAFLVVFFTWIASRNISGFLEITLLQKLPFDAGSRYAITAMSQYSIILIGILFTCFLIGIQWSNIQWLVAALGVGLGFGLQEIVANFISGLILFFEQPVRVGDIITVGQTSGLVTRIQIRATTICDWDRKELIIPNKMFITESVVNWSLTDKILRVVIPVGVSHHADVDQVEALLLKIAQENPKVLKEPASSVVLTSLGENSFLFSLRFFVPNADEFLPTQNEISKTIVKEFRKAKLNIAIPQQELHIRPPKTPFPIASVSPLEEKNQLPELVAPFSFATTEGTQQPLPQNFSASENELLPSIEKEKISQEKFSPEKTPEKNEKKINEKFSRTEIKPKTYPSKRRRSR